MLQEIRIAGHASYAADGQVLSPCKPINYVFGTNGCGKTTISRVIADPAAFPTCGITWVNGRAIECLVYNSDFAARNFTSSMRGIFTLGEESAEVLVKIEAAKATRRGLEEAAIGLRRTLNGDDGTGGKTGDLTILRKAFEETCWAIKNLHDEQFQDVFEGLRSSKARFCDKFLSENATNNSAVTTLEDLATRAATVFRKGIERAVSIARPVPDDLIALEVRPVLSKVVVGKEDVDIAGLILKLGNSDWVRAGRGYLDESGEQCPFCQQRIPESLRDDLNEFFNEAYTADIGAIAGLQTSYQTYSESYVTRVQEILALESEFIDNTGLAAAADLLTQRVAANGRLIEGKKKEPSSIVALDGLAAVTGTITEIITSANKRIALHNAVVDNLANERTKLIGQTWRYLLDESSNAMTTYTEAKANLDQAVTGINTALTRKAGDLLTVNAEIRDLERSITSVQPTVTEINATLASFGFSGFTLATAGDAENLYKIVRADGTDATTTLSEGERGFITFLYFYHLTRGSISESGMTADRIVVFDDPVSSLDSDVLFIVSSLIKRVINETAEGRGQIKQVFVLTHNIYFHKEVSFDPKRGAECRAHETFWIVRKLNTGSVITGYSHNPIKTSYELLWSEVKNENRSQLTIQNTLRRVLENYFKILGNIDKDDIVEKFEGRDKVICNSLFSWVNDGSHSVHDDLYVSSDDTVIANYLEVFRMIFDKTDHMGHYNMMMGIAPEAANEPVEEQQVAA